MPVEVTEKYKSREFGTKPKRYERRLYQAIGSTDEAEVKSQLDTDVPSSVDGMPLTKMSVEPIANDIWVASVRYESKALPPVPDVGDSRYSFTTMAQTQHITEALSTPDSAAVSGSPSESGNVIGFDKDDLSVKGADVYKPVFNFTETHYIANADVDTSYKFALYSATGKVNSGVFKGFDAGECLFLGAEGSIVDSDYMWEITFSFLARPGGTHTINGMSVTAWGWDLLDVKYETEENATEGRLIKTPYEVYVRRVYESTDFGGLGI